MEVGGDEHNGRAAGAALFELAPDVDGRLDIEPPRRVFDQDELQRIAHEGEEGPLLVAAGKRFHGAVRSTFDVEERNATLREFLRFFAVDKEAFHPFG